MDSPARKLLKQKDYQRHKMFRKMARKRKAKADQEQKVAEKALKRKLKLPKYDKGEDDNIPNPKSWKALNKIEYQVIPDSTFTRDKTGSGSIEYFNAKESGIRYNNGYYRAHPNPGNDVILYNPKENDEQDIALDALHIMPKDATYDVLNTLYRNAARDSDVFYNAKMRYDLDVKTYGAENIDPFELYFNNEADGLLRNMFVEGSPEYIESKRYYPNKAQLEEWNKHLMPYINDIRKYLETGQTPSNVLPEVVIKGKKRGKKIKMPKYDDGNNSQLMNQTNLFRRNGKYFYQASPDSEEITVTPVNTLFDDPALWTYTDDNGRLYTPRKAIPYTQSTITEKEDEGSLVEAAKNYLGELLYDINNGIPIGGKYTMPAIAASALLPLAGEAVAPILANPYVDAGLTSIFAGHGLNHVINEGIDGYEDAAMTALEITPLGRLAKPMRNAGRSWYSSVRAFVDDVKGNQGFAVSSPRIGKIFGKDAGQFTAWIPTDRPWSEGLSWINTGAPTTEGLPVQYITSKHSGEARKLYDAVIRKARKEGHPGIITGRNLISAPKTYSTLEHYYPSRIKLDDMGHWSNDNIIGLFEGPRKVVYTVDDFLKTVSENPTERVHFIGAPRYRLETPSIALTEGTPAAEWVRTPIITTENAASMTPEQWTAAQDAAIASGNMAEAQRLRDLHFKVSAPNNLASVNGQPLQLYHGTDATFNAFDLSKYGSTDGGTFGRGVYTTPVKEYAELYGKNNIPLYMKLDNPRDYRNYTISDLMAEKFAFGDDFATGNGIDGVIGRPSWKGFKGLEEWISHNPKNIKSSLPVTYADDGTRIPLGERDNFSINDIRYGLLPFLGLGTLGTLQNYDRGKDRIHIKPSKRGTFTAAAKRRGIGVQEFARKVLSAPKGKYSSAMRKKANFSRNASKFKH